MKRAKFYILGAYLLILLNSVSSYYLIEDIRQETEVIKAYQTQIIGGLSHVYNEVMLLLNRI